MQQELGPIPDAFVHLPWLRGKLTPAEQSGLRATLELLAHRGMSEPVSGPAGQLAADRRRTRSHAPGAAGREHRTGGDLWIYGYGSLMWDPAFHFAEVRLAELHGYQRRFCYRSTLGRGSRGQPALMLALERGDGCCTGLAFRIAGELADVESAMLWRREMVRGGYSPLMLPVTTPQGDITALVMTANVRHADYWATCR